MGTSRWQCRPGLSRTPHRDPGTSLCSFFPGTSGRCSGERRPPLSKKQTKLTRTRFTAGHVEPKGAVLATILKLFEEGVVGRIAWLRHALLVPNAAIGPAPCGHIVTSCYIMSHQSKPPSAAWKGLRNSQPGSPGSSPPGGAGQPGGVVAWPQAVWQKSGRYLV